jgi:putative ABC transport system permease protein
VNWLAQLFAVSALNVRTIGQRMGSSVVALVGIAGVVVVFVAVLSIAEGFTAAMREAAAPDRVIVMRSGSDSEMTSGLGAEQTTIISEAPGVLRTAAGPAASPELYVVVDVPKRATRTDANVPLRGVTPRAFDVKTEVRLTQGRRFTPGTNEIIVGRAAHGQFAGLDVGNEVKWGQNRWKVVGLFESNGSVAESEIWCDARVLQPAYRRGNSFQSVYVRLESLTAFDRFKDALTTDPRLNVSIRREADYYAEQSQVLRRLVTRVGYLIAALMGVGAVFGALNTMYNAVSSRTREIATLRALGFGRFAVLSSVLAESVVLSLVGGTVGGALAWLAFDGYQTATMNWQSFSQVAFSFAVTPSLLIQGIFYAAVMGLVGGLFPAIRAARLPIVTALREL